MDLTPRLKLFARLSGLMMKEITETMTGVDKAPKVNGNTIISLG